MLVAVCHQFQILTSYFTMLWKLLLFENPKGQYHAEVVKLQLIKVKDLDLCGSLVLSNPIT